MAISGDFTTSAYNNRSVKFAWQVESQSTTNNQTTIYWQLTGSGSHSGWIESGNFKLIFDDTITAYSSANRIRLYNGTLIAEGRYTFTHDSNGNKSFKAYAEAGIYTIAVNCSGNASFSLPQIARSATINTWGSYGVNKSVAIDTSSSVGFTKYSDSFYYRLRISIPQVVAIKYINNYQNDGAIVFTTAEKNTIYSYMTTSKTITLGAVIETYTNSSMTTKIGESSELLATAYLTSPEPTISSVTYADTNSATIAITGNNQKIVRNKSTLVFTLNTINALKSATLVSATATINGVTKTQSLSGSSVASATINFGVVNVSNNTTATITITDSRGYTKSVTKTIQVLDYTAPYAQISCQRENNFYSQTNLKVNASHSSLDNTNALTIKYQTKKVTDASYGSQTTINNNQNYVINLDNNYQWNVKVTLSDSVGSIVSYILFIDKGIPIAFYDRILSSMGVNCFPTTENSFEVAGDLLFEGISIIPVTLYEHSTTGTTGNITLSETKDNFKYLEIYYNYYRSPDSSDSTWYNYAKSIKVLASATKFEINEVIFQSDRANVKGGITHYSLSGTSLNVDLGGEWSIGSGGYAQNNTNAIRIVKVVGYR